MAALVVGCDQQDPAELESDETSQPPETETSDDIDAGNPPSAASAPEPSVPDAGEPELDYFPLIDGAVWTYRHSKVGEAPWNEVVTLTEATGDEASGFKLIDEPNRDGEVTEQLWRWIGTSVMRITRRELEGGNIKVLSSYDPGFTRFDTRWKNLGFMDSVTYTRTEQKAGESLVTEERTQVFEVLDTNASVTIDDTTYDTCLLVTRTRPDTGDVGHYWFAPGVGKIKEVDPDSMTTEELIGFERP